MHVNGDSDIHMRKTCCVFIPLVLAAFVTTACALSPAGPVSPAATSGSPALSAEQVAGTWTLISMQPAGQAEQPAPAGATYNLTLADGRASARADCNTCVGSLTVSGQTLTIGPAVACTRAACPTMAFENIYTAIIAGDSNASVSGNTLALTSSRGRLTFAR